MDEDDYINPHLCSGEPTINSACESRSICHRYKHHLTLKRIHSNKKVEFLSAFTCQQNNYAFFLPIEPFEDSPLVALSNGMIVRTTGKKQSAGLDIYKIVIPNKRYRPLVFDGSAFYTTDNMTTLEPCDKLDASIINLKGNINERKEV